MINRASCILIASVFVHNVCPQSSNVLLVHTMEQIVETNYVVLDKPHVCISEKNSRNDLLIAVKTAPGNHQQRNVLRQTWLVEVKHQRIPYVFVLGATTNEQLISELLKEDSVHGDLLIGKPVDHYHNLTLKIIFLLAWTKTYCPTQWLFYLDDDTVVNTRNAINFVAARKNVTNHTLYCQTMAPQPVIRDPKSKWFVPKSVWKDEYYLNYCSGNGYIIPSQTVPLLHRTAANESCGPKLYIDDAFVTGIATAAAGIQLVLSPFLCCMNGEIKRFNESVSLGQMGKGEDLLEAWEEIREDWTYDETAQRNVSLSLHQPARFNREGYYFPKRIYQTKTLFHSLLEETNYLYWLLVVVPILILVLYFKAYRRLRSFRFIRRKSSRRLQTV